MSRNMETARRYNREFFQQVRQVVLPAHPFNKQTCCRDCYREWNRDRMQRVRAEKRDEVRV